MTSPYTENLEFELDTYAGDMVLYAAAYRRFTQALEREDATGAVAAIRMGPHNKNPLSAPTPGSQTSI